MPTTPEKKTFSARLKDRKKQLATTPIEQLRYYDVTQAMSIAYESRDLDRLTEIFNNLHRYQPTPSSPYFPDKQTFLLNASATGWLSLVKWLITNDPTSYSKQKDTRGNNALALAIKGGHLEVVKWHIHSKTASVTDSITRAKDSSIGLSIKEGQRAIMIWLLDDQKMTLEYPRLDVMTAISSNHPTIYRTLLSRYSRRLYEENLSFQFTPFRTAIEKNNINAMRFLLEIGLLSIENQINNIPLLKSILIHEARRRVQPSNTLLQMYHALQQGGYIDNQAPNYQSLVEPLSREKQKDTVRLATLFIENPIFLVSSILNREKYTDTLFLTIDESVQIERFIQLRQEVLTLRYQNAIFSQKTTLNPEAFNKFKRTNTWPAGKRDIPSKDEIQKLKEEIEILENKLSVYKQAKMPNLTFFSSNNTVTTTTTVLKGNDIVVVAPK
jgi:hypothetical protein